MTELEALHAIYDILLDVPSALDLIAQFCMVQIGTNVAILFCFMFHIVRDKRGK